jgi:site-specific recombinase XerD
VTERLAATLKAHRHLRGSRVLVQPNGEALTMKIVQDRVASAARRARVRLGVHILRHTFCSHLAMRGAPARAIQELAGHQDLKTTQRYMHLSPAAVEGAIRLLDSGRTALDSRWRESEVGNMLATGSTESANVTR